MQIGSVGLGFCLNKVTIFFFFFNCIAVKLRILTLVFLNNNKYQLSYNTLNNKIIKDVYFEKTKFCSLQFFFVFSFYIIVG